MIIAPGEQIGPYRILEKIGAGGMGEVYRAQDTRLDRVVAVKVLLSSFAADPERLRRFEQEARTLAALNHPNILAVHDLGTQDGTPYLVSEFLEGQTLRDKLDAGLLPVKRATDYALGIARGLAAGHGKGVVHRDIKPENIFLTRDGGVKVLDFGLAKLAQPGAADSNATLLTGVAGTTPGMVLGTVGYMSPEQVRGEPAEVASDIFSFGAVLYEMLSGKRAFKRDTSVETMAAVLREEPPELNTDLSSGRIIPPGLQRIVERCLEKDPQQRFQSARDLAFAIESLSSSGTSHSGIGQTGIEAVAAIPAKKRAAWLWPVAAVVVCAIAAAAWWYGQKSAQHRPPSFTRITFQNGYIPMARFSHDGQSVIYGGQFDNSPITMYSVDTNVLLPTLIPVPSAELDAVSPTGQMMIGTEWKYANNINRGTLSEVPTSGGTPRALLPDVTGADYGSDGKGLAVTRIEGLGAVLEYPAGQKLHQTSGYLDYPRVSPDGKWVAFDEHPEYGDDRGYVSVVDAAGHAKKLSVDYESIQGVAWKSDREVWYTATVRGSQSELHSITLDGKDRTILSAPEFMRIQDIAADGRVLMRFDDQVNTITVLGPDGKLHPHMELFDYSAPRILSPDGKTLIFSEYSGSADELYLTCYRKTDGSAPVVLGKGDTRGSSSLSPDGKTVAAIINSTPVKVALYPLDMGGGRTLDLLGLSNLGYVAWFPDGKRVIVWGMEAGKNVRSYAVDLSNGSLTPLGPGGMMVGEISSDGRRAMAETPQGPKIYEMATHQMSSILGWTGDDIDRWTVDGNGMLVTHRDGASISAFRLDLATGKRTLIRRVDVADGGGLVYLSLLVTEDSKAYALGEGAVHSTLWVLDGVK